jgi:hypothetical protein
MAVEEAGESVTGAAARVSAAAVVSGATLTGGRGENKQAGKAAQTAASPSRRQRRLVIRWDPSIAGPPPGGPLSPVVVHHAANIRPALGCVNATVLHCPAVLRGFCLLHSDFRLISMHAYV